MPDAQVDLVAATLRLTCGTEHGSAFLVSETHALTSRHSILDHLEDASTAIELRPSVHSDVIRCTVVDVGIPTTEDAVLLKLDVALPSESVPPLVASHIPSGTPWQAFGFPRIRGALGALIAGHTGRTIDPDLAAWDVELTCDTASQLASYAGASGSPVVVAGAVRAMLQGSIDGALGAISLRRLQSFLRSANIEFRTVGGASRLPSRLKAQLKNAIANTRSASDLESAIAARGNGYVVLSGTPGSGKSLLVAGFEPVGASCEIVCRYFAGEPDVNNGSPALQRLPRTFADWLCQETALISPDAVTVIADATTADCAKAVAKNLEAISQTLAKRDVVGVILIDDAVGNPAEARASLLETLPVVLPHNIAVVLTTTDGAALVSSIPDTTITQKVQISPLLRRDAEAIAHQILPDEAPYSLAMKVAEAANGHPLVLTLLARQYAALSVDQPAADLGTASIELDGYYERLWLRVSNDGAAVWLLATLACLRGTVTADELLAMVPAQQRTEFPVALAKVKHLLHQDNRGLAFYHDSFRTFVAKKAATLARTVHENLRDYSRRLGSDYAKRNLLFHELEAGTGATQEVVAACTQDFFDQAALVCADPELLLEDLGRTLERAIVSGNFIEVTRLLLLRNRVRFRYNVVFAEFAHELAIAVLGLRDPRQALAFLYRQGIFVCGPGEIADLLRRLWLRGARRTANEFFQRFRVRCWAAYDSGQGGMNVLFAHLEAAVALAGGQPRTAVAEIVAVRRLFEAQFDDQSDDDSVALMRADLLAQVAAEALWFLGATGPMSQEQATDEQYAIQIALTLSKAATLTRTYGVPARPPRPEGADLWDANFLARQLERLCDTAQITREVPAVLDGLISYGAAPQTVTKVWTTPPSHSLREDNGVDFNPQAMSMEFDAGRVEGYCERNLPTENRVTRFAWELRWLEMARLLGRIAGDAARRRRDNALVESDVLLRLQSEVWPLTSFTLYERASWEDSYAIPEAASVHGARLCAAVVGDFAPSAVPELVAHYLGLPDQCGLYTEGFRGTLRALARRLAFVASDKRQVADLLRACVRHVTNNVFNRTERVGELLACAAIATDIGAQQLTEEAFRLAIACSLGPSWYKEAQFSLLADVIEEANDAEMTKWLWPEMVKTLELACGESTFQRFVRNEKQRLVSLLATSGDLSTAVSLYFHYVSPSLDVQAQRVERVTVDHITRWRGARFGVGEIDEQAGILGLLEGMNAAGSRRRWALVELFWPGDKRHDERFAEHARRSLLEDDSGVVHRRGLVFLRADADDASRPNYLERLTSVADARLTAFADEARAAGLGGQQEEPEGHVLPPPDDPKEDEGKDDSGLRLPGVFGRPGAMEELRKSVEEARVRLERGDPIGARETLVSALRNTLDAEWSMWDGSQSKELELLWSTGDVSEVTRALAPLIQGTRFSDDWMIVSGLLPGALGRMRSEERTRVMTTVTSHVATILQPESSTMRVDDELTSFRHVGSLPDADSAIDQVLVELLDHPNAHTRERVADVIFWLLSHDPGELLERLVHRIKDGRIGHGREIAAGVVHAFGCSSSKRAATAASLLEREMCTDDPNLLIRYALNETLRLAGRDARWETSRESAPLPRARTNGYRWQLPAHIVELLGPLRGAAEDSLRGLCGTRDPEDVKNLIEIREGAFNGRAAARGNPWEREAVFRLAASVEEHAAQRESVTFAMWNPAWPSVLFDCRLTARRDELLSAIKLGDVAAIIEQDDNVLLHRVEMAVVNKEMTELEVFALLVSDVYFDGNFDTARALELVSVHEMATTHVAPSSLISHTTPAVRAFKRRRMVGGDVTPSFGSQPLMVGMGLKESDLIRGYWHERRVWRPWGAGPLPSFGAQLCLPKPALRTVPGHDLVWVVRENDQIVAVVDPKRMNIYRGST